MAGEILKLTGQSDRPTSVLRRGSVIETIKKVGVTDPIIVTTADFTRGSSRMGGNFEKGDARRNDGRTPPKRREKRNKAHPKKIK